MILGLARPDLTSLSQIKGLHDLILDIYEDHSSISIAGVKMHYVRADSKEVIPVRGGEKLHSEVQEALDRMGSPSGGWIIKIKDFSAIDWFFTFEGVHGEYANFWFRDPEVAMFFKLRYGI